MVNKKNNGMTGEIIPKRGRPDSYPFGKDLEKLLKTITNMSGRQATVEQICSYLHMSTKKFYKWQKEHEEFRNAYQAGKDNGISLIKGRLFDLAVNQNDRASMMWFLSKYDKSTHNSPKDLQMLAEVKMQQAQIEVMAQQARKAKAEADIAEYKARMLTNPDSAQDHTIIIDDIQPEGKNADSNK